MLELSRHVSSCPPIMGARQAVLLTPSRSSYPSSLPFYKHHAPVSPLLATLTRRAELCHSTAFSCPLFSYSYALFCTPQKINSFLFNRLRTLWSKQGGAGVGCISSHDGSSQCRALLFLPTFNFERSTFDLFRQPAPSIPGSPPTSLHSLTDRIWAAAFPGALNV